MIDFGSEVYTITPEAKCKYFIRLHSDYRDPICVDNCTTTLCFVGPQRGYQTGSLEPCSASEWKMKQFLRLQQQASELMSRGRDWLVVDLCYNGDVQKLFGSSETSRVSIVGTFRFSWF